MSPLSFLMILVPFCAHAQNFSTTEILRWEKQASNVVIIRDHWGIPHIYGKTDADAVFGLLYAQCEDDFKRVEMNYIEKLGRMSEVKGARSLYDDLLIRMIIDSTDAIKDYQHAPSWMKKICNAFADAVNYYLYKHADENPALLTKFQPWYPFLWTDGSIGAINTADLTSTDLENLYARGNPLSANTNIHGSVPTLKSSFEEKFIGSNGFAFSPKITQNGHSILYINPHVTFYFRPEVHMCSEEGLNVYGAVTWGQFFIYQGFNEHCGWMHTSSAVDVADTYLAKISKSETGWIYAYEGKHKKLKEKTIEIKCKIGETAELKTFQTYYTHHGPLMANRNGQWLSLKSDNRIAQGLMQCWLRNKANCFNAFKKTLDLKGNISNNTVYADAEGNIAYWHGNRIPKRDPQFNWSQPMDGSSAATEWKGYHDVGDIVQCINPSNGWLQNCNATPFTVAGNNSPKKENFPTYMAPDGENFRGINAVRTLSEKNHYDLDQVIKAGYDTRLAAFETLVPALVNAFEKNVSYSDSMYAILVGPVALLKGWDSHCAENSIATTLAIEWGERLVSHIQFMTDQEPIESMDQVSKVKYFASHAAPQDLLLPLIETIRSLENRFGRWQVAWGQINRFQRFSSEIESRFDDKKPSIPIPFASSAWGMLPSYQSRTFPGTQKRYGEGGNSFVCAVEFGKPIKAKSLLAGGNSGDEHSAHFFDQGLMYSKGQFKDVLFYKTEVLADAQRIYHPGE